MISPIVLIIVSIFFLAVFLIGIIERKKITLDDYWVNARKTNKWILIATIGSTYVGVGSLIANAGVAYKGGGLATFIFGASTLVAFFIFARFFAPKIKNFGDTHNAYSMLDFLEFRYSRNVRIAGLILLLVTLSMWLAIQFLGMGIFVSSVGGFNPTLATLIGGLVIIAYTTVGGLRADIRTDVFQFFVMLSLLFIFLPLAVIKGGGWEGISSLPVLFLSGQEFAPWYVFLLGFFALGAGNFVSADLWQRAYAGDTPKNVRWSMTIAGIFVTLFLVAGTLFGIYGKILLPEAGENMIVPALLHLLLPPFLFGIVLAGFFAAIMSTADTILLILGMTVVHDLYQKVLGKEISKDKALKMSRVVTFVAGALALTIALIVFNIVHLAIEAASFFTVLLPAIVFGFYWKKAGSKAALWSIILGFITIVVFLFVSPIQAFIPGMIVGLVSFVIIQYFEQRKSILRPGVVTKRG